MTRFQEYCFLSVTAITLMFGDFGELMAQDKVVDLRDPAFAALGAPLFAKNCAVGYCHGSQGASGRGPRLRERHWNSTALFNIIHDGVQNTAMPGWSDIFSREEIWAVTAYVISLGTGEFQPASGKLEIKEETAKVFSAEAERGRALFFDLTNQKRCSLCHSVGPRGATIGPELTSMTLKKSVENLLQDITDPNATIAKGFGRVVVVSTGGARVSGIQKGRHEDKVQIYDVSALPPPLRTFYKEQIVSVSDGSVSAMPAGYGDMYSPSDLSAIVAFLKSDK